MQDEAHGVIAVKIVFAVPFVGRVRQVDELGRLELERGGLGLTNAVDLVKQGPRPGWPHALIVVRDWLVPRARMVFGPAWNNEICEVGPTPDTARELLCLFAQ